MQTFGARRVAAAKKLISGPNLLRFRPKITPTPIISYSKNSYPLNPSTSHTTLDDASEKEIVDVAKTFTLDRILPQAQKFDKSGEYPWILMRQAHQLGLMNTDTPAEYGGLGLPLKTKVKIFEEIGFGCTGLGTSLMVSELAQIPIRIAGTEALREKYLRKMVDEPVLASFAVTEANAGSDLANLNTFAQLITINGKQHFQINGSKVWITNGGISDWFFVLTKTSKSPDAQFTGFIVDSRTEGVHLGKKEENLGQRCSDTRTIHFDNVTIPAENMVGKPGDGFKLAMMSFDRTRPIVAALACGLSKRALIESVNYASQRTTFGKKLADHQGISFKLAEMSINFELSRLATAKAAENVDQNTPDAAYYSSIAKCFAADSAVKAASNAVQIFGGNGFNSEYPAEKLLRDSKVLPVYGGASEIQKIIITKKLFDKFVR